MDLIYTLIMYLALRALFHRASSGLVKEKDFWCRAQGCQASEFLHSFSCCKVTPGTWEVKISRFTNNPRRVGHCLIVLPVWKPRRASTYPVATRMAGKLNFGTHCVHFCVLPWTALKLSRLPMNLQSWEEESEIRVSWGWGDWGQSRVGSRQSKCWCLPCNTLGCNSAGHLGWLCPLAMI